jgi:hypothetical protein
MTPNNMEDEKLNSLFKWAIKITILLVTLSAIIWIIETHTETVNLPGKVTTEIQR